jgi:hypothetical protein
MSSRLFSYNKQLFTQDVSFNAYLDVNNGGSTLRLKSNATDSSNVNAKSCFLDVYGQTTANGGAGGRAIFGVDGTGLADNTAGAAFMGSWSNHPVLFYSNGAERMRILSAGNVGIGTNAPSHPLDVNGWIRCVNNLRISRVLNDTTNYVDYGSNDTGHFFYGYGDKPLYFGANGIEYMRLLSNGNFGIGTSSPGYKLHVNGTSYYSDTLYGPSSKWYINNGGYGQFTGGLYVSGGAFSLTVVGDSNGCLKITPNNSGPIAQRGNIALYSTFNWANDQGSRRTADIYAGFTGTWQSEYLSFGVGLGNNSNDGQTPTYEKMRITWDGRVGVATSSPQAPLHINSYNYVNPGNTNGYVAFGYGDWPDNTRYTTINTGSGNGSAADNQISIYALGKTLSIAYIAYSDSRIKSDIVDINDGDALSILRQIQPKSYGYIDKFQKGNENVFGFIAQEVKNVLPKAVSIVKDTIPSFYTLCQVSPTDVSNIMLLTSHVDLSWNPLHDASGNAFIDSNGNACSDASGNKKFKIRLYDESNNKLEVSTTDIVDSKNVLIDVSGCISGTYFLYGQEVDDFHTLDKNAIFTVATAALQEVDGKQQAQAVQIQAQAVQIQAQAERISTLETQNASFQSQIADLQSKIEALIAKVGL